MSTTANKPSEAKEITVEEKLRALYSLQTIDSKTDEIHRLCGELPLEVQDLEDELVGLDTRIQKTNEEIAALEGDIAKMKNEILQAKDAIEKYKEQQGEIRNSRQFDSINKEIEFQQLEIDLRDKKIRETNAQLITKKNSLADSQTRHSDRTKDLEQKKNELESIIADTQKEEEELKGKRVEFADKVEERLLKAYDRIRSGAKNGLAIVPVMRDACGGCYNKIPPQRQLDVASHQKVIVCEYCGRILIDVAMATEIKESMEQ
ncbi:MAG: C4-type zinc ribbon domain-containing protein [Bacteroidales bacterium]|nr:C4-type zinc ribbon domain-containing protein [Bacteroidales bacterium]